MHHPVGQFETTHWNSDTGFFGLSSTKGPGVNHFCPAWKIRARTSSGLSKPLRNRKQGWFHSTDEHNTYHDTRVPHLLPSGDSVSTQPSDDNKWWQSKRSSSLEKKARDKDTSLQPDSEWWSCFLCQFRTDLQKKKNITDGRPLWPQGKK